MKIIYRDLLDDEIPNRLEGDEVLLSTGRWDLTYTSPYMKPNWTVKQINERVLTGMIIKYRRPIIKECEHSKYCKLNEKET